MQMQKLESPSSLGYYVQQIFPPPLLYFLRVYSCRLKQLWWCGWSSAPPVDQDSLSLLAEKSASNLRLKSAVKSRRQITAI